jgi:hypothetical protein
MPSPFPNPTAPGAVPADQLAAVEELHALCRRWCEHIPQHVPYTDLIFAFGFATLGDATRARRLLGDARVVMQYPVPPTVTPNKDYSPVSAALVPGFAYRAFEYRVEQAIAGQPLAGPLSPGVRATVEDIEREAGSGPVNSPYKLATYHIARLREQSRILEPDERINPYTDWSAYDRGDPLRRELAAVAHLWEPAELTTRLPPLIRTAVSEAQRDRWYTLHQALPLAIRVGEGFAAEMLEYVRPVLAGASGEAVIEWYPWLMGAALFVAGRVGRADLTRDLARLFADQADRFSPDCRVTLISTAGWECLRSLQVLGLRDATERLLIRLWIAVPDLRPSLGDLRAVAAYYRSRLVLAAGWLTLGRGDEAAPVLDETRRALLAPDAPRLEPKDYTDLARAYVSALGRGPADAGLPRVAGLFREMDRRLITNNYATASYYSRLHLNLTEDAVAAVCRMLLEPPP